MRDRARQSPSAASRSPAEDPPTLQTMLPGHWVPRRTNRHASEASDPAPTYLVPVAGPPLETLKLDPASERAVPGLVVGRHESSDLQLSGADEVSRRHARFQWVSDRERWDLSDVGSSWGTYVNGQRLKRDERMAVAEGDLIRVTPWTFLVSHTPHLRGIEVGSGGDGTVDAGRVKSVVPTDLPAIRNDRLELLLNSAGHLQAARNERELAARLLKLAQDGTRLGNAVVLKPVDAEGRYEVLSSRMGDGAADASDARESRVTFSRSLLDRARSGEVAEVSTGIGADGRDPSLTPVSQSIVQMEITRAVCVPILLGETASLLLYLDQRGQTFVDGPTDAREATAFCVALGRIASLALANLKRLEMERRSAEVEADIASAAAAQQWILPDRQQHAGGFEVSGESRPGRGVGGDFFDVLAVGPYRAAVALGDVSGKGVSASVLMTATQGFLNAALADASDVAGDRRALDLAGVVRRLNAFVHPRRPSTRFVTLWVGLFDRSAGTLTYVDAGHSLALLRRRNGNVTALSEAGGLPIGISLEATYESATVRFEPGDATLVVSDGIVEQPALATDGQGRDEFEIARVQKLLTDADLNAAGDPADDLLKALYDAVIRHAGTPRLADDATAVLVRHGGESV